MLTHETKIFVDGVVTNTYSTYASIDTADGNQEVSVFASYGVVAGKLVCDGTTLLLCGYNNLGEMNLAGTMQAPKDANIFPYIWHQDNMYITIDVKQTPSTVQGYTDFFSLTQERQVVSCSTRFSPLE